MAIENNKVLEYVKKRFSASEKANSGEIDRFARYYDLYRGRRTQRNYTGMADLFIPEPHRIVKRKTAKMVNSIKAINVLPEGVSDKDAAKTAATLASFLTRKLSLKNFYRAWIKESRIVGAAWARITWDVSREEADKPWKGYKIDMFSVDRVFINPKKTMLDIFQGKLDYAIFNYEADLDSLKGNKNYDKTQLELMGKTDGKGWVETALSQARQIFQSGASSAQRPNLSREHDIKEYWGKYDGDDMLFVIADDKFVLRNEKNPYADILDNPIPAVMMPASVEPNEISPIGDIEPNESLFNELNDTRNQRMDTVTLNIDPAKEILRSAYISDKDLIARRGWTIKTDIPGGLRFIPPDMQGVRAAIDEERIIRGDIQQSTGVLDFAQDSDVQAGVSVDTARGALIAKGESDILTEDEIDIVKEALKQFWVIMIAYAQNFLDRSFTMRLTENGNEEFFKMSKESLQGSLDIDPVIETLQDKTTRQQINIMLLNIAKDIPGAKIGKFFTDVVEVVKDNINIEDYFDPNFQPAPASPNVSVSLKGDISELQADQIYKTIPGVDPVFGDPIMSREGRNLMAGILPEDEEDAKVKNLNADTDKKLSETVNNLMPAEEKEEVGEVE